MVKPPKNMQPEAVDLVKIEKKGTRGMGGDDFRNYMARKIDLQRKQIGLVLPPDPRERQQRRQVRFADDVQPPRKKRKVKDMSTLLKHLKKRHGWTKSPKRSKITDEQELHSQDESVPPTPQPAQYSDQEETSHDLLKPSNRIRPSFHQKDRSDLFFRGVIVLVNGYTAPDIDTLMRLLHKHGGDLEKYETTRVTHIIAQNLSTAKANMYKRQRNPRPVCRPEWIVDSAKAGRLLPHADYLIDEVRPIEFQRPVTCHAPKRGSLANPTLSQVDMAVLASLPPDIRSEIEDQLGCSNDSMGIGIEEQAIGQQGSPTVLSQCDDDGHSAQTSYTGQNSPFEWNGDDLVLPPFSQIHMSQVAELPGPLRKNIIAQVLCPSTKGPASLSRDDLLQKPVASVDADFGVAEHRTDSKHSRENGDAPVMRQLSVKRMLKLAAVKSGQDTALSNRLGGSVSLTQLECLPLEMQLQIANDEDIDNCRRTASSPLLKGHRPIVSEPRSRASSNTSSKAMDESKVSIHRQADVVEQEEFDYTAPLISEMPSFYQENIKPLKEWMDKNPDASDEALQKVREFLSIVASERRFADAAKLLRSIKNRRDEWSGRVYQEIKRTFSERTREVLGSSLDLQRLGL